MSRHYTDDVYNELINTLKEIESIDYDNRKSVDGYITYMTLVRRINECLNRLLIRFMELIPKCNKEESERLEKLFIEIMSSI